jgi:hypothetical protein
MLPVQFFARLDLEQICLFLDGHDLNKTKCGYSAAVGEMP